MSLFPLAAFDVIDDARADEALVAWGHYLGECERPFARQSFGLDVRLIMLSFWITFRGTWEARGRKF